MKEIHNESVIIAVEKEICPETSIGHVIYHYFLACIGCDQSIDHAIHYWENYDDNSPALEKQHDYYMSLKTGDVVKGHEKEYCSSCEGVLWQAKKDDEEYAEKVQLEILADAWGMTVGGVKAVLAAGKSSSSHSHGYQPSPEEVKASNLKYMKKGW